MEDATPLEDTTAALLSIAPSDISVPRFESEDNEALIEVATNEACPGAELERT